MTEGGQRSFTKFPLQSGTGSRELGNWSVPFWFSMEPHPLFKAFIGAAYEFRRKRLMPLIATEAEYSRVR